MKLFLQKTVIALLPIVIIFAFPLCIEIFSGELLTVDTVLKKETEKKNIIYGPAYSDQTVYFKTEMIKHIQPEVLAIGNSKLLTMRAGFFNEGVSFYNAGGTASDIASFRKLLEVTQVTPKVIIMTIEPLHFDPVLVVSTKTSDKKYQNISYITRISSIMSQSWLGVYGDYFQKKFTIHQILERNDSERIGLNARINDSGLRNDGSYHYGKQYQDKDLRNQKISKAITFIETKTGIESKEFFSTPALNELDNFLSYCKERNIQVIGFIPPTPKVIEETYKKYPKYEYMFHTFDKTLPLFQKYNFTLYNFFSLESLGATDEETIDEYHTSEKVMLRAMIKMSDSDQPLSSIVNKTRLQKILNSTKDQNDILK
jgi:hypothetical protein